MYKVLTTINGKNTIFQVIKAAKYMSVPVAVGINTLTVKPHEIFGFEFWNCISGSCFIHDYEIIKICFCN